MNEKTVDPTAIQNAANMASSMKSCPVLFTLNIGMGEPLIAHPAAHERMKSAHAAAVTSLVVVFIKATMLLPMPDHKNKGFSFQAVMSESEMKFSTRLAISSGFIFFVFIDRSKSDISLISIP